MEILHRGTPPSEREFKSSCHNCKTVFKFKQSEAKYRSDQRDGDYLEIACPVCSQLALISASLYLKPPSVDPY